MKYIEEYIPKLHIHQHSLLTRKVFFRHNFSALVFFSALTGSSESSSSSSHLDHHKKMASLDLDHHLIWINITGLDLDHHSIWIISLDRIWIISRSGSSLLDLDRLSIWISRSHHNWIWIITRSGSPLVIIKCVLSHHRKFYRASPISCWL